MKDQVPPVEVGEVLWEIRKSRDIRKSKVNVYMGPMETGWLASLLATG